MQKESLQQSESVHESGASSRDADASPSAEAGPALVFRLLPESEEAAFSIVMSPQNCEYMSELELYGFYAAVAAHANFHTTLRKPSQPSPDGHATATPDEAQS